MMLPNHPSKKPRKLVKDEDRETGFKWSIYKSLSLAWGTQRRMTNSFLVRLRESVVNQSN